jgi:LPPG:FO 2-phospho-L-lactate transferase
VIVVLTGGTGGAKFVDGLRHVVAPEELTIIVNTGDDHPWWGLYVSPDIDSITYMLADKLSNERGWGVRGDTFHCLQTMKQLDEPEWFSVGDRDLATHLLRTKLLAEGNSLSAATRIVAEKHGLRSRILPMCDERVETRVDTRDGEFSFEEYFVQRRFQDKVIGVRFVGAENATPAPGVLEAIASATSILIAPSNPVTSIGPILAVPGIRDALRDASAPVVAVSPMIGNRAVSGPAAELLQSQGLESSIAGVAKAYEDFLDVLVVSNADSETERQVANENLQVRCADILMRSVEDRIRVAKVAIEAAHRESERAQAVETQ